MYFIFSSKVNLLAHSLLVLVSYLYACAAAHSSRLHVSSQKASVKSDQSLSSRPEPGCTSHCFGFTLVGAKENGGNVGLCAQEAWEQAGRPANNCGQTVKGRFSHTAWIDLHKQITQRRGNAFTRHKRNKSSAGAFSGKTPVARQLCFPKFSHLIGCPPTEITPCIDIVYLRSGYSLMIRTSISTFRYCSKMRLKKTNKQLFLWQLKKMYLLTVPPTGIQLIFG